MKKVTIALIIMLCAGFNAQAIKPLLTDGFDKYNNSFKIDLVSLGYMSPQIVWEHYTNTRFSYGVSAQAHFLNRSSIVRQNEEPYPATVELDGQTYNLIWNNGRHPMHLYADIAKDGGTHEVKWDRKYVGFMVCPEGRYYFGRKPDRGLYAALRFDIGYFQEQFDVSVSTESVEYLEGLSGMSEEQKAEDARYKKYRDKPWHRGNVEDGESFLALGGGIGLGYQCWFKQNSHWGMDFNVFGKLDNKFSEDDNNWEWTLGAGSFVDFNLALIYRF